MTGGEPAPKSESADERFDELLARALRGEPLDDETLELAASGEDADWLLRLREMASLAGKPRHTADHAGAIEAEPELPWRELGGYRLIRRLGEGGMGVVYLAEQSGLGRFVALKVLRPELASSPTALERLAREARAIAKLRHPNIASVHALGEDQGVRFFTMDVLPGEDLDAVIARHLHERGEPLPVAEAARYGIQIADALACAHGSGILHRDVKPHNVRVLPDGHALLMDFGLARDLGSEARSITREFAGSPSYAAPEQITARSGARPDARVDVWGLAATLYECVTGRPPFAGETIEQVMHAVLHDEPMRPRALRPGLSRDFETVLLHALEKDPARRYPSADALGDDLRAVLELRPIAAREPRFWTIARKRVRRHPQLAAIALAAIVVLVGLLVNRVIARLADRAEALRLVAEVRTDLDALESRRGEAERAAMVLRDLETAKAVRAWTADEASRAVGLGAVVDAFTAERADAFARADSHLATARRLHADPPGIDAVSAQLDWQRWLEARQTGSRSAVEYFRRRVLEQDHDGTWARRMDGRGALRLTTDPPGAEVFLFQYALLSDVFADEEPRVVPMRAVGPAEQQRPGVAALRIVRASGELEPGDLVLGIDDRSCDELLAAESPAVLCARVERGGSRATVWRSGRAEDLELPAGLAVRVTRAPLLLSDDRRVGTTPIDGLSLQPAWYVALVRKSGCEDVVVPFHVDHAAEHFARCAELSVSLLPIGTTPAGFVRVAAEAYAWGETGCFLQEREVTCAEYRDFVAAAPRDASRWPESGPWSVVDSALRWDGDARALDEPVLGVTWHAARAFAAWADAQWRRPAGYGYALPTSNQWLRAGKGGDSRYFVFGNVLREAWLGAGGLPAPRPLPAMSCPTDESPFFVYDLTGNAAEWCDDDGIAAVCGGSWRDRNDAAFRLETRRMPADTRDPGIGFRIALRRIVGGAGEARVPR